MRKGVVAGFIVVVAIVGVVWFAIAGTRGAGFYAFEPAARPVLVEAGAKQSMRPRVAVGANGSVYMLAMYGEGDDRRLGLSTSHDGGDSFLPMTPVSAPGAHISSHGESAPALARTATAVYAIWQESGAEGDTRIMVAHGDAMGHKFDAPVNVVRKEKPSFNGFANIAVAPNGDVYAVWLDGRDSGKGTFSVYLAKSTDKGKSFSNNVQVAESACPCCRPAVIVEPSGDVHVAWRKVFEGNVRDMVIATSQDAGATFTQPAKIADDHFVLDACPDSGPSLAISNGHLYAAWYTETAGRAMIHLAVSQDGGKTFGEAQHASGNVQDPNHPVLKTAPDGQVVLVFQGRAAGADGKNSEWASTQPFVVTVSADGSVSKAVAVPSANAATYPDVAAASAGRVYVAWTKTEGEASSAVLTRGRR